jgi:hypothetical protein
LKPNGNQLNEYIIAGFNLIVLKNIFFLEKEMHEKKNFEHTSPLTLPTDPQHVASALHSLKIIKIN